MAGDGSKCPSCGANVVRGAQCWLCQTDLRFSESAQDRNPYRAPDVAGDSMPYSSASIVLVVLVLVVCGFLAVAAPGLGVPLAIVTLPALIHTVVQSRRKQAATGEAVSATEKATLFVTAVAGAVAAFAAAAAAFFVTCIATCFGLLSLNSVSPGALGRDDHLFALAMGLAGLVGLVVGASVLRAVLRRR